MILRRLAFAGLLGGAAAGPYVASQAPGALEGVWGPNNGAAAAEADPVPGALASPNLGAPGGPGSPIYKSPAPLGGPVGLSLEQAFDWNVTRNWVYSQWARKSTGLADPTLFGVRVPLVTGSGMTDLAGSLSYYFDRNGAVQRIRFQGRTADTSRIIHLAATRFGMQPRQPNTPGDQLLQSVEGNQLRGELRTRPEGTLWATSPHSSFDVRFEATRNGSPYTVAPDLLKFEVPPDTPRVASNAPNGSQPAPAAAIVPASEGSPILPPRSLIPDRPPVSNPTTPGAVGQSVEAATPKPPAIGAPTTAPGPQMKPLDGYRQRFRWPG